MTWNDSPSVTIGSDGNSDSTMAGSDTGGRGMDGRGEKEVTERAGFKGREVRGVDSTVR